MRAISNLIVSIILLFFSVPSFAVTASFTAVEDSFISETDPTHNFGSDTALLADGDDGLGGELWTLIKWDVSSIPSNAIVSAASIKLNLFDSSGGPYNIIRQNTPWSEGTVNWGNRTGSALVRGIIPAFSLGQVTIPLNEHGINLVQGWLDGGFVNNGITIRTAGTTNGIDMDSRESGGFSPTLEVTYTLAEPTLESLQAEIDQLKALLAGVTRTGDNLNFDGMNVRIRNGLGATNGNPDQTDLTDPTDTVVNGLGNLIVGYDEPAYDIHGNISNIQEKTGSHNIVVGPGHNYSSFGGLVSGFSNRISGPYTSVNGGFINWAKGIFSSIGGGRENFAQGQSSTVSGGETNNVFGFASSISGGYNNVALGENSSVNGGFQNRAEGRSSSILGGRNNETLGSYSTISGGNGRTASGTDDWVAGSLFEDF